MTLAYSQGKSKKELIRWEMSSDRFFHLRSFQRFLSNLYRYRHRDTESAMYSIYVWLIYKYLIGSSLEGLEADSFVYLKQMKALKRDQSVYLTKALRQVVLNLLGRENADDPTRFSGDSLSEEELELYRDNPVIGSSFLVYHGILLTYFGEHVHYADMVIQLGHDHLQKAQVASPNNLWDTFLKGVSCFAAAQETGLKKYAKLGQIFRSKIQSWLDMGNPNVKHYGLLLDAEWTAFQGDKYDAIKQYEAAIVRAGRGGYQQDAALATERLGEFYLRIMGDRGDAAYQIEQSIKYWREWGAIAKVRHLEEKYADLLPNRPTEIVASNGTAATISSLDWSTDVVCKR
jgi:hypothetical protein